MSNEGKRFKDYPESTENPFLQQLSLSAARRTVAVSKEQMVVSKDGELTSNTATMALRTRVEKASFVKIYKMPFQLPGNTLKVFMYLLSLLKYGETKVYFNPVNNNDTGICSKTVYKCLCELMDEDIIYKAGNHWYHVNPLYGFKGDRLQLK